MPSFNEAQTRQALIDPALLKAGWNTRNPDQVGIEIPIDGSMTGEQWQKKLRQLRQVGYQEGIELPKGITDYLLFQPNGEVIAVVEAKKTSIQPALARTQTRFYVEEISKHQSFTPFAFMTNGHEIRFWDVGVENDRLVQGFFTPKDLERLKSIRENKRSLITIPINPVITDRIYQQEAIRRVCEAFEVKKKRKALLVMATGTGKTRTIMSLIDVLLQGHYARKVLFVADRLPLVDQALNDGFKTFFPHEPIDQIFTHQIDENKRLYAVSLQTLSNCFQRFSPGYFDLIVFDEVHRSIFNQYRKPIEYFDARIVGLTATPADFIDRNTFLTFECDDKLPTALYTFEEAVKENYLVNFILYQSTSHFQRAGIKALELDDAQRNSLLERGLELDDIDFAGTDLEKKVSNKDTIRQHWAEFMDKCHKDESGQLPAKTIVFALTQAHALRLAEVFQEMYPQFVDLVEVITYKSQYKGQAVKRFKKAELPRIAISVDMLDTGVDIPEVMNLVFMKPVLSFIKLWQMIGRGTRSHAAVKFPHRVPNGKKLEFLILDFWDNNFQRTPQEDLDQPTMPVLVTLFNARLRLLETLLDKRHEPAAASTLTQTIADVREMIAQIPLESFTVKKVFHQIERAWQDTFWSFLTQSNIEFLRFQVGPLLREVAGVDVAAATFTGKIERLKLQLVSGKNVHQAAESIAQDVSRIPDTILSNPQEQAARNFCLSPDLLTATPGQLDELIKTLARLMKQRKESENNDPLLLDLKDYLERQNYVFLYDQTRPVYVAEYQERVANKVLQLLINHPAIEAIEKGQAVGDDQLLDLERVLRQKLSGPEVELTETKIKLAYGWKVDSFMAFVRELLALDGIPDYGELVDRQFKQFAQNNQLNAAQLQFLRAVQSVFLEKRRLAQADLYMAPALQLFGMDAVERFFNQAQQEQILTFAKSLQINI